MKGALLILLALVVTGVILYIHHRLTDKGDSINDEQPSAGETARPEGCCGQHLVCEKESLLAGVSKEIEYYEDEELDAYRGISPDEYTDEQIEQFRDVLYTLRPEEIGGWARSIRSSNAFGFIELNDGTYFSNIQECFSNREFLIYKMIFHFRLQDISRLKS